MHAVQLQVREVCACSVLLARVLPSSKALLGIPTHTTGKDQSPSHACCCVHAHILRGRLNHSMAQQANSGGDRRRKRAAAEIDVKLGADREAALNRRRIDFLPARVPDVADAATGSVRVLNPQRGKLGAAGAAAARSGGEPSVEVGAGAAKGMEMAGMADPDVGSPACLPRAKFLFSPERLERLLHWQRVSSAGPGLNNLGNTCFMNATLQCLTHTPPLANLCLERVHSRTCRRSGWCAYCEFESHVRAALAEGQKARAIAPRGLATHLRSVARHFRPGRQEDAHEFFICLVEAMQNAAVRGATKSPQRGGGNGGSGEPRVSPVVEATSEVLQVFGGRLRSQVRCCRCQFASNSFEPFMDLSLELRRAPSVDHALQLYTVQEKLTGDNRYKCADGAWRGEPGGQGRGEGGRDGSAPRRALLCLAVASASHHTPRAPRRASAAQCRA